MDDNTIEIWCPGIPAPGGSKRGFFNKKTGRVIITDDNKKSKPWMACVSEAASQKCSTMLDGPLRVRFDFVFPRPKGHYRTGKNAGQLKADAPPYPIVKPDATKVTRSTEDALKGIAWRDDSQIVTQAATKRYGDQAGCLIRIKPEPKP